MQPGLITTSFFAIKKLYQSNLFQQRELIEAQLKIFLKIAFSQKGDFFGSFIDVIFAEREFLCFKKVKVSA